MMSPALRARLEREAGSSKLIENAIGAQIRTELTVEDVVLIQRTDSLLHVRAAIGRRKAPLTGGVDAVQDRLEVDLVEEFVPASPEHPDGLAVAEWQVRELRAAQPAASGG
jgi:hypothetical protein